MRIGGKTMRRRWFGLLVLLVCGWVSSCDDDNMMMQPEPRILAQKISSTSLPEEVDASRTYDYIQGQPTQPDVLLGSLWKAGLHPRRAWRPLPEGALPCPLLLPTATFTVELDASDPRILQRGFVQGTAGLECTTVFMRYQILD